MMTVKEYREYKDEYIEDFEYEFNNFLKSWLLKNESDYDRKLNDMIKDIFTRDLKRIKTLTYFPEYDLPD